MKKKDANISVTDCCKTDEWQKQIFEDNDIYFCGECLHQCDIIEVCEHCFGSGEISIDYELPNGATRDYTTTCKSCNGEGTVC